jgi:hypothetical protein
MRSFEQIESERLFPVEVNKSAADVFDDLLAAESKALGYKSFTKAEVATIVRKTGRHASLLSKAVADVLNDRVTSFGVLGDGTGPLLTPPPADSPEAAGWGATLSPPAGVAPTVVASVPQAYTASMAALAARPSLGQFAPQTDIDFVSDPTEDMIVSLNVTAVAATLGTQNYSVPIEVLKAAILSALSKRKA